MQDSPDRDSDAAVDLRDGRCPGDGRTDGPADAARSVAWPLDPLDLALQGSVSRQQTHEPQLPSALCLEIGRRLTLLAFGIFLLTASVWWRSQRDERRSSLRGSPWDMTVDSPCRKHEDLYEAFHAHQFDTPAIGIRSAEGWHEHFWWTDTVQADSVHALRLMAADVAPGECDCTTRPAPCAASHACSFHPALAHGSRRGSSG